MATISQIKIGNQTYDIHDAVMGNRFNNGVLQRAYGGTGQTTADALDGEFSQNFVTNTNDSGNTYFRAVRTDTGHEVNFGVGAGGDNRGIWDLSLNNWIIYADGNNNVKIPQWQISNNMTDTVTKTIANEKNIVITSTTISNGSFLLIGNARFDGHAGGTRVITITSGTSTLINGSHPTTAIVGGAVGAQGIQCIDFVSTAPSANRNLVAYQSCGASLEVKGSIRAIRLGPPL